MSDTIKKTNWLQTSTANKAGTILWAISTLLFLLVFINLCILDSAYSTFSQSKSPFTSLGFITVFPIFILYVLLAIGMFTGKNVCTVIAKSYGLLLLIMDILIIIFAFVAIKLVLNKVFNLDLFQMIGNMLASARETAGKVDKAALSQYAQTAGVPAQLPNISLTPEAAGTAKAAAKLLSSFMFISIAVPLTQLFTILGGFLLKVDDDKKSRVVTLILWLFMGMFGGHLLYVKRTGAAVVRMVLTVTGILAIIPFILGILDLIKILSGKFEDNNKQLIVDWT